MAVPARDSKLFATPRPSHECGLEPREISDFANASLMKSWLQHCKRQHDHDCGNRLSTATPQAMIRLIDTKELKLVKGNLHMEFVALSYVWGHQTKPLLTKSVEASLFQPGGLNLDELPKTLSDAIKLSRSIGQRFIWIDTSCIIQDDDKDKAQQLGLMDSIFNSAELVLVAASTTSVHSGIPGVSEPRRRWQGPIVSIQGSRYTAVLPNLLECLDSTIWQTRGWTFQEGLLARRLLIFDHLQTYWNCRVASHCENIFSEYDDNRPRLAPQISLFEESKARSCRVRGKIPSFETEPCRQLDFMRKVENFTSRRFTDRGDALWAFLGILKLCKPHFPNGYIWGLPSDSIDVMLLWNTDCTFKASSAFHTVSGRGQQLRKLQFPSWTWLAKGCNVQYDNCDDYLVSMLTWYEPLAYPIEQETEWENITEHDGDTPSATGAFTRIEYLDAATSEDVCRFKLLHFDAPVAYLDLQPTRRVPPPMECEHHQMTGEATIMSPDGLSIGTVKCPGHWLSKRFDTKCHCGRRFGDTVVSQSAKRCQAAFIHLSTYLEAVNDPIFCPPDFPAEAGEDDWHAPGCRHADNVNLMLIEWDADHKIAYRIGLTRVQESLWRKIETRTERIVLG